MMQSVVNNTVRKGFSLFTIEIKWNQTLQAGTGLAPCATPAAAAALLRSSCQSQAVDWSACAAKGAIGVRACMFVMAPPDRPKRVRAVRLTQAGSTPSAGPPDRDRAGDRLLPFADDAM